jgi:transposase-like protein
VKLVTSDSHEGLRQAIGAALGGATWQRCRVHFMRNMLTHVPKGAQSVVAAGVRMIFMQPDHGAAQDQLRHCADGMQRRFPKAAELLLNAEDEILAYMSFPSEHWLQTYSTNPLERLNKEIGQQACRQFTLHHSLMSFIHSFIH